VADWRSLYRDVTHVDRSNLSLQTGVRAALLVMAPLVLGLAVGQPQWVYAAVAAMMVLGTIAGATIAAAVTLGVGNVYALEILLFAFGITMFATRGVNFGLVQVSFTPFLIILLNLLYPGEWYLAEVRILDVAIGGAIAVATVYVLWIRTLIHDFRGKGRGAGNHVPSA
jgi:uncharacterized membrane protein YccC